MSQGNRGARGQAKGWLDSTRFRLVLGNTKSLTGRDLSEMPKWTAAPPSARQPNPPQALEAGTETRENQSRKMSWTLIPNLG